MPGTTGGRTPDAPDRGVCAISPSDLVGYVGNLISRVKELEQRVEELEAENVVVGQVTSLSQQIGWASGITYMGTSGWTQTEYGTLIPPPGVTLASLGIFPATGTGTGAAPANSLQFILKDENGNILFAFNAIDGLYGDQVDLWNAGGDPEPDYGIAWSTGSGNNSSLRNTSVSFGSSMSYIEFTVAQAGLWAVNAHILASDSDTTMDCSILIKQSSLDPATTTNGLHARALLEFPSSTAHSVPLSMSGLVNLAAGETVRAYVSGAGGSTSAGIHFHIHRLGS